MSGTYDTQAARTSQIRTTVVQIYPKINKSDISNLIHIHYLNVVVIDAIHIHPLLKNTIRNNNESRL